MVDLFGKDYKVLLVGDVDFKILKVHTILSLPHVYRQDIRSKILLQCHDGLPPTLLPTMMVRNSSSETVNKSTLNAFFSKLPQSWCFVMANKTVTKTWRPLKTKQK